MEYDITFDRDKNYFYIKTMGDFSINDFFNLADDLLNREDWQTHSDCLFDYRETSFLGVSSRELELATHKHSTENQIVGAGKSALVMRDINNYGMGRMYEGMTSPLVDVKFMVFTDMDEAVAWLTQSGSEK